MNNCPCGKTELVRVRIPADLSCSGRAKWKRVGIDKCIAPIVDALQKGGIDMRGSCCGHGNRDRGRRGEISLQDGRILFIAQRSNAASTARHIKMLDRKGLDELVMRNRKEPQ